jgi:serine/threonine-protein kinase HipA
MATAKPNRRRAGRPTGVVAQARVHLWDRLVGVVTEYDNGRIGFSYDRDYVRDGVAISPRWLPLQYPHTFEFADLRRSDAFLGLPGVLADSLPDRFGNLIIRSYFESRGEPDKAMSAVQRLLYVGNRAMGALEYEPHLQVKNRDEERALEIKALVESARKLIEGDTGEAIGEIMRVGGSAGGARAKALILWDRDRRRVRSGFARPKDGEQAWIVKFDGVGSANALDPRARSLNRIEYTYALLAQQLGISMQEVSYVEEGRRFHFMTRRFDRAGPHKHHMHSLGGITHVDFNQPQAYSYEAWLRLMLEMKLGQPALDQGYRRMIFNIVGRNQDDHVKNISLLMKDRLSGWELGPAYDLTFAAGAGYTRAHQMTATGRADGFVRADLVQVGRKFSVRLPERIIDETLAAFAGWRRLAKEWGVSTKDIENVSRHHRLRLNGDR